MIPALKAEFRKVATVRSTYIILGICLLLEIFFAFWVTGVKANGVNLHAPDTLAVQVTSAITVLATIFSLVGVLLVTHEYRYNTIMYTLTLAKSRSQVLLAKLLVISVFAIVFSLIFGFLSPVLAALGFHVGHHVLAPQHLAIWSLFWRCAFAGWGASMLALILAFIIRIQVGAFAAVFLIPGTIEPLIGLLIKKNVVYLPYSALDAVRDHNQISYAHAALVALAWIVGGWIIAWILFLRRDAN